MYIVSFSTCPMLCQQGGRFLTPLVFFGNRLQSQSPPPPFFPLSSQSWQIFILPGRILFLESTQHHLDPSVVNQVGPQAQEYHLWSNIRYDAKTPGRFFGVAHNLALK
ncbi:unnamed protein product [Pipistrellus nathusii]|uniref:Uncharacterized protein n=1 Tax=Pipistrellus nathusii TaxID=59473 RepID=A0ABP0ACN6_PIPNA